MIPDIFVGPFTVRVRDHGTHRVYSIVACEQVVRKQISYPALEDCVDGLSVKRAELPARQANALLNAARKCLADTLSLRRTS